MRVIFKLCVSIGLLERLAVGSGFYNLCDIHKCGIVNIRLQFKFDADMVHSSSNFLVRQRKASPHPMDYA